MKSISPSVKAVYRALSISSAVCALRLPWITERQHVDRSFSDPQGHLRASDVTSTIYARIVTRVFPKIPLNYPGLGLTSFSDMMDEREYRKQIQKTFDRIERAFEKVDPDIVECEQAQGAMNIVQANGGRCILSAQPSLMQLWLVIASRGAAYHFNFDATTQKWLDDRNPTIELGALLRSYFDESSGLKLDL